MVNRKKIKFGDRAADALTEFTGSWKFLIGLMTFITIWIVIDIFAIMAHWDPWPFIILNLILSCLATLQAPIILMSQNRSGDRDRRRFEYDYKIDRKSEKEIQQIKKELVSIKRILAKKK